MDRRDRRNACLNISTEVLWGFQAAMVAPATLLTVLLAQLGATKLMVGAIPAIESAGLVLPQLLGNYLFASRRRRKIMLVKWHFFVILPLMALMAPLASPALPLDPVLRRALLLACWGAFVVSAGVVSAAWFDWVANLFATSIRGTVMGITWGAAAVAGVGGAITASAVLAAPPGQAPSLEAYMWLYVASAVLGTASVLMFWQIDDSLERVAPEPETPSLKGLLGRFGASLRNRNFRSLLIGRALAVMGFCVGPLVTLYYKSPGGGGLTESQLLRAAAALSVATAITCAVLGRLGDRWGHRVGIIVGTAAQAATLGLMLLTSGMASCVFAYAGMGICAGANMVSHYNLLFETCPHEHRMAHITVGNLIIVAFSVWAPLAAGAVAQTWDTPLVFRACLVLSIAALAWFVFHLKEPRKVAPAAAPVDVA